jgi:hypothetical protein
LGPGSSGGYVQHLRDQVGQHNAPFRYQSSDAQTRLTRPRGDVEVLMIFSGVGRPIIAAPTGPN